MVYLMDLWLPILLSGIVVFLASSVIHMVLPYHKGDFKKLPDEEAVMKSLRKEELPPGEYSFPRASSMKDMSSPEMVEKFNRGPVGMLKILPTGQPEMGKALLLWFVYCVVASLLTAYVTGRTLAPGTDYLSVFRVTSVVSFLAYSMAHASDSIWMGRSWSVTLKNFVDGFIYGLLTGGVFGWLWPS